MVRETEKEQVAVSQGLDVTAVYTVNISDKEWKITGAW
jgi:hypothetical protein